MTTAGIYDFSFSISIHTVYVVSHTERQTYTQNHTEYVRCDFEFSVLLFFGFDIFLLTEAVHLLTSPSFQSILAQKVLQDVGEELNKAPIRVLIVLFFCFHILHTAGLSNFHGDVWWYNVVMVEGHCHTGTPLSH